MKTVSKRIGDVEVGDVLLDEDGNETLVVGKTAKFLSHDMYDVTFENLVTREVKTIRADGSHVWPMDPYWSNSLPDDDDAHGMVEASTKTLNDMYARGLHPQLSRTIDDDGNVSVWAVYSCYPGDPEEVQCLNVDAPTHTFMLAADGDGVPTHNCGGPLTLDTMLVLADGGRVSMGEVKTGDRLVSIDGEPTTVVSTSPVMTAEMLYEFEFEDR